MIEIMCVIFVFTLVSFITWLNRKALHFLGSVSYIHQDGRATIRGYDGKEIEINPNNRWDTGFKQ